MIKYYKNIILFMLPVFVLLSSPLKLHAVEKLEHVTLQLQWKDQFQFAGFYAAKEKGFYKDAGLDVQFKPFENDINIIDEVIQGKAEYGLAYAGIIQRYLQGDPLIFLANFSKQSPLVVVTQEPYKLPSDLKDKRIMVSNDKLMLIAPLMMLKKFNIKSKDFTAVPHTFKLDDFLNNRVDAMIIFLSNETFYLNKSGIKYNILNPANYGIPSYDLNLFTTKDELTNHPQRVAKFREMSIKGWEYALSHKDEIIRLIQKKYNSQKKSYQALKYEADQLEQMMLTSVYPIGSIDPKEVKYIAETMLEMEFLPKNTLLDFSAFIYKTPPKNIKLNEEELNYLIQRKAITYCADPIWMPFSVIENGKHLGMDADYIHFISKKIDHAFKLIPTKDWDESMQKAISKECDILSMVMETPLRKKHFNFTKTFVSTPFVAVTTVDKGFINDLNTLDQKPIGIVKGYALTELLSYRYPHLNIVEVSNVDEGLRQVENGELYAFMDNLVTLGYLIENTYIGSLKISAKIDMVAKFGYAVRQDDPLLLSIMNKAIDTIDSGIQQEIHNRWNTVSYNEGINKEFFWLIILAFFIILLFIYFHYNKICILNKKLHDLSNKDSLSGLYNRRHIETLIKQEQSKAQEKEFFALILVDIDDFKKINDTCGHDVGDRIIQEVSKLLEKNIDRHTVISRWGGEEFLIFCAYGNAEEALILAEHLRNSIESYDFGLDWNITGSFGVAEYTKIELLENPYIQKVDQALQKAKNEGKNRVVIY